jgi:glycosyltransferase involved in cell wall biosynthesis
MRMPSAGRPGKRLRLEFLQQIVRYANQSRASLLPIGEACGKPWTDDFERFKVKNQNGMRLEIEADGVDRFGKNEASPWSCLWSLLRFVVVSAKWLDTHGQARKFDFVHVHNIPNFLIFFGWPAKRGGAWLVLDIHDIVPELFASKFGAAPQSLLVRSLKSIENILVHVSDHIFLAHHIWRERYTARAAPARKCSVFMNHVDRQIFQPQVRAVGPRGWQRGG